MNREVVVFARSSSLIAGFEGSDMFCVTNPEIAESQLAMLFRIDIL